MIFPTKSISFRLPFSVYVKIEESIQAGKLYIEIFLLYFLKYSEFCLLTPRNISRCLKTNLIINSVRKRLFDIKIESLCCSSCSLKSPWFSIIILIFLLRNNLISTGLKAEIGSLEDTTEILFSEINLFSWKILKK